MPEGVVDLLEPVQVEAEHGEHAAAPEMGEGLLDPLAEHGAVGQAGEDVVAGHVGDAGIGLAPLGHVLVGRDHAAPGHGLVRDGEDASVAHLAEARTGGRDLPSLDLENRALLGRGQVERGHVLVGRAERQVFRREVEQLAIAPVDDGEVPLGVEQAQALRHVVEGGVEAQVGRLEMRLLDLQQGDVAADRDEAAGAGTAAADPEPAPVEKLRLARRRPIVVVGEERAGERVAVAGDLGERRVPRQRLVTESEEILRLPVDERDPPGLIDHHDAFEGSLEGVGEMRLRRDALRDLLLHRPADVVAHDAHGGEEGAEFVRAAGRDRHAEVAGRDPRRDHGRIRHRPHDAPRQQESDEGRHGQGEQRAEQVDLRLAGDDGPGLLPVDETVAGGVVDEEVEMLFGLGRMPVDDVPIGLPGLAAGEDGAGSVPILHRALHGLRRLGRAARLGPLDRHGEILGEHAAEGLEPAFELRLHGGVGAHPPTGFQGAHIGEIGGGGPRVIDRHEGLVEGPAHEFVGPGGSPRPPRGRECP